MMNTLKPLSLILAAAVVLGCHGSKAGVEGLYARLQKAAEQGTPLYGHQDDLMYGHDWNANQQANSPLESSDVKAVCGAYPAVLGLDLGGIETGSSSNLDGNDFDLMRRAAVLHHERGGVVSLSWHLRNPLTGGDSWDVSSDGVVASILPGGEKHEEFRLWMERAADYIDSLRDSNGERFEIIWRPWHEHGASWFWWGMDLCTAEQYNALWRMNHDYFVKERKLDNLIWALSPNTEKIKELLETRYPGDDVMDIIGLDLYAFSNDGDIDRAREVFIPQVRQSLEIVCAFAAEHGKLAAFTETGFEGIPDPKWWTTALSPAIKGFPICYVLTWRNASDEDKRGHYYGPWSGEQSAEDFSQWLENDKITMIYE